MPDKAIRCYDKQKKTPISEWQIQCPDNVADTVVTAAHGKVYMKENGFFEQALQTLNNNECEPGDTINAFNQSVDKSGCCPTITTRPEGKKTAILPVVEGENKMAKKYRIRKLTSKECYRLMGFTDKDYKATESVISESQRYKTAGNSIVKQVLMAIFLQMGIRGKKKWNEMSVEERQNLVDNSLDFI